MPRGSLLSLSQLRDYALTRSLFAPTTLARAIERLGYIQADPIRAPARAQDLTLAQRVRDYRAGDLEAKYPKLAVEEDFLVNYGFVSHEVQQLMHPRKARRPFTSKLRRRAEELLAFVKEHEPVHPRHADAHFAHGSVTNYWGGTSNATTHLLDAMHYRGMLRVVRREQGIRLYGVREPAPAASRAEQRARLDRLIDVIVATHAPLPTLSLHSLVSRLRYGVPQWTSELRPALTRAKERYAHAHVDGVTWYWPSEDSPERATAQDDRVRLLAPFDPVVWDRRRFEMFWGWAYRFEAYTPESKRRFGYYALPILFRGQVIGWGNLKLKQERLEASFGYLSGPPRDKVYRVELESELERMRVFLGAH